MIADKVRAYIFHGDKILVFHEPEYPEACHQVPGGTVDPGEELEVALVRELFEETGREFSGKWNLIHSEVITHPVSKKPQREHVYLLKLKLKLEQEATHGWDHVVSGGGEDQGILFRYEWLSSQEALELLLPWMKEHLEICLKWLQR